ncbi:MAG: Ig-like domain-containing protein [Planctomycetota bacterium]
MGKNNLQAAWAALALCACGGGGASGTSAPSPPTAGAFGLVRLLSHVPSDGAVQVPLDEQIALTFDATVALESFAYPDTWLRASGAGTDVPLDFAPGPAGRVIATPQAPLEPETDYTLQLSALTSDVNGRILDLTTSFTFRTIDEVAPTVLGLDVPANATGVDREASFTVHFDEAIASASVTEDTLYLRDVFGGRYSCDATPVGDDVVLDPHADLPGDRQFFVVATTALEDRAGNRLAQPFQSTFTTSGDGDAPSTTAAWPANGAVGVSPAVQPTFTFDESMDPATVEAASLLFEDEFGNIVPFSVEATADQRTLRLRPTTSLQPQRSYTLSFLLGGAAATDVSGNPLSATQALAFTTGDDVTPPTVVSSTPTPGQDRVPGALVAEVSFDEDLDPAWVGADVAALRVAGETWDAVVELVAGRTVRVTPVLPIPTDAACSLVLRGGQDGLRDVAGNVPADTTVTFTTSSDDELPEALLLPPADATGVARTSRMSVVFDAPMDPATLNSATLLFTDDLGAPIPGDLVLGGGDRVVTFTPATDLDPDAYYRIRVRGGSAGPRRKSGNWFDGDRLSRFRTSALEDGLVPTVRASVNEVAEVRRSGLVLPPAGWTVNVDVSDAQGQWVDPGSVELVLGGGASPDREVLLATAELDYETLRLHVPASEALAPGSWSLTVEVQDLSGNVGRSNIVPFEVQERTGAAMPFERTQVVWVRTDLDRDNNGRGDLLDDMLRLGLAAEGDPNGSNGWLHDLLLQGVLARTNTLYHRGARGEPLGPDSVQVRFTTYAPIALQHMQMALGGLDPEGDRTRTFGDESTGVLGRAFYDYRNASLDERNTTSSPGTGVFPAEMYLFQTRTHQQLYPSFVTAFASRFLALCADMGGTPAGLHPLDAAVLHPGFDYEAASSSERARWNTVMAAMDDWASVIGVILAHEVGHSVGLVAPGDMPYGLFGDATLHNTYAGAAEVMAASVGYEAMTTLDYHFRDVDLAYLRQRILLR